MPGLIRRLPVIAVLTLLAILALATPASAHADLTTSDPSNGTVVRTEPGRVTLHYSEEVTLRLASIRVIGPDGRELVAGPPRFGDGEDTMTVPLRPDRTLGTYVVVWHAVAADDGHATSGVVLFAVGHRSPAAVPAGLGPGDSGATAQILMEIAIWLGFAGFALLAGQFTVRVAAGAARTTPRIPFRPAVIGWVVLLVATLGQLLCYGPYAAGQSWRQALDPTLLADTLATTTGRDLMARAVLLVLLAVIGESLAGWITSARIRWPAVTTGAVVVLCLAGTWTPISHAASGTFVPPALAATTLHVAAMGTWAGGLATLLPLLRSAGRAPVPQPVADRPAEGGVAVQTRTTEAAATGVSATVGRFSTLAFGSVCLLAITGVVQGWHDLGGFGALTTTSFGLLLLVKIGLLLIVLVVASRSRAIVRRRLGEGLDGLRRTVGAELAGLGVLLIVVTLLINTAPPPH